MKTYIIFDLDGTLLNTIDDLAGATNYALRTMGFPQHGLWVYPNMVGNGVRKLIERALPDDQRSEKTINDTLAHFKEYYGEHCCDATKPYPGIPELLADLTARGINLAVTSNKYEDAVTKIISHYFPDANFRAVLGNIDVPDPKDRGAICRRFGRGYGNSPTRLRRVVRRHLGLPTDCGATAGLRRPHHLYPLADYRPCRETMTHSSPSGQNL